MLSTDCDPIQEYMHCPVRRNTASAVPAAGRSVLADVGVLDIGQEKEPPPLEVGDAGTDGPRCGWWPNKRAEAARDGIYSLLTLIFLFR